eukprot:2038707-Amphidinium_carterae.2
MVARPILLEAQLLERRNCTRGASSKAPVQRWSPPRLLSRSNRKRLHTRTKPLQHEEQRSILNESQPTDVTLKDDYLF